MRNSLTATNQCFNPDFRIKKRILLEKLLSLHPMLNQKLQQRLMQKLSPQQVLVMRLIQEPLLALEQRIKQEIEQNPALEELSQDAEQEEVEVMDEEISPSDSIDSEEDDFVKDNEEEVK